MAGAPAAGNAVAVTISVIADNPRYREVPLVVRSGDREYSASPEQPRVADDGGRLRECS
jgi:hypothetical protein